MLTIHTDITRLQRVQCMVTWFCSFYQYKYILLWRHELMQKRHINTATFAIVWWCDSETLKLDRWFLHRAESADKSCCCFIFLPFQQFLTSCARKQCERNSKSVRFKSRLVPDLHDLLTLVYACHYIAVFAHDGQHDFFIGHWLSFWSTPSLGRVLFSIFHGVTHVLPSFFTDSAVLPWPPMALTFSAIALHASLFFMITWPTFSDCVIRP